MLVIFGETDSFLRLLAAFRNSFAVADSIFGKSKQLSLRISAASGKIKQINIPLQKYEGKGCLILRLSWGN
jgi:hypothetical protein